MAGLPKPMPWVWMSLQVTLWTLVMCI